MSNVSNAHNSKCGNESEVQHLKMVWNAKLLHINLYESGIVSTLNTTYKCIDIEVPFIVVMLAIKYLT